MDSKNIFITSQTYSRKIHWLSTNSDSEWNFIGNDIDKAEHLFDEIFTNEVLLYLVTDRHKSINISRQSLVDGIKDYIEKIDFLIWDSDFEKVIEFNKIGVYRVGRRTH